MNKKISVAAATVLMGCVSTSLASANEIEQPLLHKETEQTNELIKGTLESESRTYETSPSESSTLKEALEELKEVREKHRVDGRGKLIAVVDSGVDTSHPDFRLDDDAVASSKIPLPEKQDEDKDFTAKVPYGYNYTEGNYRLKDDVADPHGQHVAGILAGNSKNPNGVVGVAPNAQLLGYKTFSDNYRKISPAGNDAIDHAITDAVNRGADVVNLSVGSEGSGLKGDIHYDTIKNAVDKGVVIVSSLGNYSSSTSSSTYDHYANRGLAMRDSAAMVSLAATPEAIGVGSVQNKVLYTESLIVDGKAYPHWNVGKATESLKPREEKTYELVNVNFATEKEIEQLKDKLQGKVALVYRGEETVYKKAELLKSAGAIGAILVNTPLHANRDDYQDKFITSYEHINTSDFWYVSVSGNAGKQLEQSIPKFGDSKQVKLLFGTDRTPYVLSQHNRISGFSSWGPTSDLELKPDLVAPGQDIRSTLNGERYGVMSGTSMASPYVAGISTLLSDKIKGITGSKERLGFYKGFSNVELNKLLLMNTAKPIKDLAVNSGELEYSPRVQGAGLVNADAALSTNVFVTGTDKKGVVTLKEIKSDEVTFTTTLYNFGDKAQQFDIKNSKVLSETIVTKDKTEREATSSIFTKDEAGNFTEKVKEIHPIAVSGGELIGDHQVLVQPNSMATVTFKLKTGQIKDEFVEGFIYFIPKDKTQPELSVPYFGFKGDWNTERALDAPRWDNTNQLGLTSLFSGYEGNKGHNVISYLEKGIDNKGDVPNPDNISFTNRSDTSEGSSRNIVPRISFLRNVKDYEVAIVDGKSEDSKVLKVIQTGHFKRKVFYSSITESNHAKTANSTIDKSLSWDGKWYDPELDDDKEANEGQYYYRIRTKIHDNSPVQTLYLPFRIDNTSPTLSADWKQQEDKVIIQTNDNHKIWKVLAKADNTDVEVEKLDDNRYEIKNIKALDAYQLRIQALDFAGNPSEEKSIVLNENKEEPLRKISIVGDALKKFFDQDVKSENYIEKEKEKQPAYIDMFNWAMYGYKTGANKFEEEDDGKIYYNLSMAISDGYKAVVTNTNKSATDLEMKPSKDHEPLFQKEFEATGGSYDDFPILVKEGFNIVNIKIYDTKTGKLVMEDGNIVYYDKQAPRLQLKNPIKLDDEEDNMADGTLGGVSGTIYARNGRVVLEGTVSDNGPRWELSVNGNNIATHHLYQKEGDNEKSFTYEVPVKEGDSIKIKIADDQSNARTITLTVEEDNNAPTIETNLDTSLKENDIPTIDWDDENLDEEKSIRLINGKAFEEGKPLSYYQIKEAPHTYVAQIKAIDKAGNVSEEAYTIGEKPFDLIASLKKNLISSEELNKIAELIAVPKGANVDSVKTVVDEQGMATLTITLSDYFGRQTTQVLKAQVASNHDSTITASLAKTTFRSEELNDLSNFLTLPKDVSATLVHPIQMSKNLDSEQLTAKVRLYRHGKVNEMDYTFNVVKLNPLTATLRKETISPTETYDLNGLLTLPKGVTAEWSVPIPFGKTGKVPFAVLLKDQHGQTLTKSFTITVLPNQNQHQKDQLVRKNLNSETASDIEKISISRNGSPKLTIHSNFRTEQQIQESKLEINSQKAMSTQLDHSPAKSLHGSSRSKQLPSTGEKATLLTILGSFWLLVVSKFLLNKQQVKTKKH